MARVSHHYLPSDAINLAVSLYEQHRTLTLMGSLLLWAIITTILRQRFHRWGMDLVIFAAVATIILLFVSACLYLLTTHPGYHLL